MNFGILKAIIVILALVVSVSSQRPKNRVPEPERPLELVALLNQARLASPEIFIETVLRLAESKKIKDAAWLFELFGEADMRTDDVKNPVRRRLVPVAGISVDNEAGYLSYAYDLRLDKLSLKSRLIKQMARTRDIRAKQIVFQIGGDLDLKPLKCEDSLVYDVSEIYSAVGSVAKTFFSSREISEGIRAIYLSPWLENLESPSQIGPAMDLLLELKGSSSIERQMLFNALASGISKNFADDRSFTYAVERDSLNAKIARLVSGVEDAHIKEVLIKAYRDFLIKNLQAPRCFENYIDTDKGLPRFVSEANILFVTKPITVKDVATTDLKGKHKNVPYWQSASAARLLREFRNIKETKPVKRNDNSNSEFQDWANEITIFIQSLEEWRESDAETESQVFQQKCVLYSSVINLVDDRTLKTKMYSSYIAFLANASIREENIIEWLYHVNRIAALNPALFIYAASNSNNADLRLLADSRKLGL